MKSITKGFTLMELLIVIGVLGILAAGLLAAIDPFEQLKKARDTNNRGAATELLQASQRYYATHGYLPWYKTDADNVTYSCVANGNLDRIRGTEVGFPHNVISLTSTGSSTDIYTCLSDTLLTDGEIKDTFFSGLATPLYIYSSSKTKVGVCFAPEAKSNRTDEMTKYLLSGTGDSDYTVDTDATCPDPTAQLDTCLQCFE